MLRFIAIFVTVLCVSSVDVASASNSIPTQDYALHFAQVEPNGSNEPNPDMYLRGWVHDPEGIVESIDGHAKVNSDQNSNYSGQSVNLYNTIEILLCYYLQRPPSFYNLNNEDWFVVLDYEELNEDPLHFRVKEDGNVTLYLILPHDTTANPGSPFVEIEEPYPCYFGPCLDDPKIYEVANLELLYDNNDVTDVTDVTGKTVYASSSSLVPIWCPSATECTRDRVQYTLTEDDVEVPSDDVWIDIHEARWKYDGTTVVVEQGGTSIRYHYTC